MSEDVDSDDEKSSDYYAEAVRLTHFYSSAGHCDSTAVIAMNFLTYKIIVLEYCNVIYAISHCLYSIQIEIDRLEKNATFDLRVVNLHLVPLWEFSKISNAFDEIIMPCFQLVYVCRSRFPSSQLSSLEDCKYYSLVSSGRQS